MDTERIDANEAGIARAVALLRDGQLVAFATETVYGLGADATDPAAVAAIYEAKGRPDFNPLIAHVVDRSAAEALVHLPEQGRVLAAAFWPGPLTLVAPIRTDGLVAPGVTAGLSTLAVRVPAHPVARALLTAVGRPVAAPSANPSGRISPTTAEHVLAGLRGRIAAVLDAGPCAVGLESTIVGVERDLCVLLRPGGITSEAISRLPGVRLVERDGSEITAPGQLASHYAPEARLRLNALAPREDELWLGFGPGPPGESLSATGDLAEAAARLFDRLRALDAVAGLGRTIAVAPIPETGLGRAINDRLRRAAAPR